MASVLPAMAKENSTGEDYDFYLRIINVPEFWLGLATTGFAMSAVTFVSNAILLFIIYKDPRQSFRTAPSFLIANLSASELLLGIVVVFPVALRDVLRYLQLPLSHAGLLKAIIYIVVSTTLFVSRSTLIAMSLTCYIAINNPMFYRTTITEKRIKILIASIWIVALPISLLPATNLPEKTYTLIYLHTHVSLPAIVLTVAYINVFHAFSRRKQDARVNFKNSRIDKRHTLARERNMAITIITILVLFFITCVPLYTTLHLLYLCKTCQKSVTFHKIDVVASRLLFISSSIDPFIYAWRVPKYRQALRDCFNILKNSLTSRFRSNLNVGLSFSRKSTTNINSSSSCLSAVK